MIQQLFGPLAAKILLGVAGTLLIIVGAQRCTIERLETKLAASVQLRLKERDNHRLTKANFRGAMQAARAAEAANLARVANERARINERISNDFQALRRDADARYRRLLDRARTGAESAAGDAEMSAIASATCRAYAATECDQLPAKLKAAQDNTDQLISLQAWVAANVAVATSPAPPSPENNPDPERTEP